MGPPQVSQLLFCGPVAFALHDTASWLQVLFCHLAAGPTWTSPFCSLHCCFLTSDEEVQYVCAQLCLTLCNPMDCSPPGTSVHGIFPGKNTGVGCHFLLQGIFPIQGRAKSFKPKSLASPALAGRFFTTAPPGKPRAWSILKSHSMAFEKTEEESNLNENSCSSVHPLRLHTDHGLTVLALSK